MVWAEQNKITTKSERLEEKDRLSAKNIAHLAFFISSAMLEELLLVTLVTARRSIVSHCVVINQILSAFIHSFIHSRCMPAQVGKCVYVCIVYYVMTSSLVWGITSPPWSPNLPPVLHPFNPAPPQHDSLHVGTDSLHVTPHSTHPSPSSNTPERLLAFWSDGFFFCRQCCLWLCCPSFHLKKKKKKRHTHTDSAGCSRWLAVSSPACRGQPITRRQTPPSL